MTREESRYGEARESWILARDAAVLALLYGAGLRISEALAIRRRDAPLPGVERLKVTGKGNKQREIVVLPQVAAAVHDYVKQCPYALEPDGPLFRGAKGGPLSPRIIQLAMEEMRGALACRKAPRRMLSGILSPRICSHAAATFARFRSF